MSRQAAVESRQLGQTRGRHGATLRVPRTRGAFGGLVLIVLGVWGALIPFLGPTFDYAYTPSDSWHWTLWRFWLEVLPGGVAVLGGLLLLVSADRVSASLGGWLGVIGGGWYVVGLPLAPVVGIHSVGVPAGTGKDVRAWEAVGMFYGLGAVIVLFAALALGRLAVVGVRDVAAAERHAARRESERLAAENDREAASRTAPAPVVSEPASPLGDPVDPGSVADDDASTGAPVTRKRRTLSSGRGRRTGNSAADSSR
jgi:hypothetical protein